MQYVLHNWTALLQPTFYGEHTGCSLQCFKRAVRLMSCCSAHPTYPPTSPTPAESLLPRVAWGRTATRRLQQHHSSRPGGLASPAASITSRLTGVPLPGRDSAGQGLTHPEHEGDADAGQGAADPDQGHSTTPAAVQTGPRSTRGSLELPNRELSTAKSSVRFTLPAHHDDSKHASSGAQQEGHPAPRTPSVTTTPAQQRRGLGQWRSLGASRRQVSQKSRFVPRALTMDSARSPGLDAGEVPCQNCRSCMDHCLTVTCHMWWQQHRRLQASGNACPTCHMCDCRGRKG
jgi:hypothetical protein